MDVNKPLVSIICATFNGSAYLAAQLDSIIDQTYSNTEIIVSDDVSTDNTWEILLDYAKKDNRIKIFRNTVNVGFNRNFESLVLRASGQYIALSDQDDVWHPRKIDFLLDSIGSADIAFGPSYIIDLNGIETGFKLTDSKEISPIEGVFLEKLIDVNFVPGHAMLIDRLFFLKILPFDVVSRYVMYDYYISMRANFGNGIAYSAEAITYHRIHGQNTAHSRFGEERSSRRRHSWQVRRLSRINEALTKRSWLRRVFFRSVNPRLDSSINPRMPIIFDLKLFIYLRRRQQHIPSKLAIKLSSGYLFVILSKLF